MPAALVIPAPRAYIEVDAMKKLVVGFVVPIMVLALSGYWIWAPSLGGNCVALSCRVTVTVEKSAGFCG